jgi:isopenicillin-N N-acyltransferase-like protein
MVEIAPGGMSVLEADGGGASDPPHSADDLVPLMCSPVEDGRVAVLPDPSTPEPQRLATLVTVRMDPAERRVRLSPGIPQCAEEASSTFHL